MIRPFSRIPEPIPTTATVEEATALIMECVTLIGEYLPSLGGTLAMIRYNGLLGVLDEPSVEHIDHHMRSVRTVMTHMNELLKEMAEELPSGAQRCHVGLADIVIGAVHAVEEECCSFDAWWLRHVVTKTQSYDDSMPLLRERIQDRTLAVMVQIEEGLGSLLPWLRRKVQG